jgi:hypothetical protein
MEAYAFLLLLSLTLLQLNPPVLSARIGGGSYVRPSTGDDDEEIITHVPGYSGELKSIHRVSKSTGESKFRRQ